jgi:hypothetical protein
MNIESNDDQLMEKWMTLHATWIESNWIEFLNWIEIIILNWIELFFKKIPKLD